MSSILNNDIHKLRDAAIACRGWIWPDRRRDPETGTHYFGRRSEDGDFSDIGTIDASTYTGEYVDDLRVLKFLRLAQPETVLALIAQVEQLNAHAARYGYLRNTPGMLPLDVWDALEGICAVIDGKFDQDAYGRDLDHAIDAAVEAQVPKGSAA